MILAWALGSGSGREGFVESRNGMLSAASGSQVTDVMCCAQRLQAVDWVCEADSVLPPVLLGDLESGTQIRACAASD